MAAGRLCELAREKHCEVTTRGRRSGRPHKVPVWFATDGDSLFLATLKLDRDWPKNLRANPEVSIRIGNLRLEGRARLVEEPVERESIERLLRKKYLSTRIAGWFGLRPEGVFEIRVPEGGG